MRIIAIGGRTFITGFRLAGVAGIEVREGKEVIREVKKVMQDKDVGLIIIADDVAKPIHEELTEIRAKQPVPLLYEIPAPGSPQEKVEYRDLIKSILKV